MLWSSQRVKNKEKNRVARIFTFLALSEKPECDMRTLKEHRRMKIIYKTLILFVVKTIKNSLKTYQINHIFQTIRTM